MGGGQLRIVFVTIAVSWIISVALLCNGDGGEDLIKFQDPSSCNFSQNETFSWAFLGCVRCQWKVPDSPDYCPCSGKDASLVDGKCVKCSENSMLYDGKYCITCGVLNPYSLSLGKCLPCPPGSIEVAYNIDGSPKKTVDCVKCFDGFIPHPNGRHCIPCHSSFIMDKEGKCSCPELGTQHGGVCLTNQELSDTIFDAKTAYKFEYNGYKLESALLRDNLISAYYLCKGNHNQTACQILANLCTLNLHSYGDDWTICRFYRAALTGSVTHPPAYIPKIYYSDVEAPSVLIRGTIPYTHDTNYDHSSSDVNITISKFSFTGEFLGIASIEDIIPCREPKKILRAGRKFGTKFGAKCELNLKDLWKQYNRKMIFLDPYVSYEDPKRKELHLYPVPVKIMNFKRNGVNVNTMEDKYQWQFVRRFFIIDTIGSLESNSFGDDAFPRIVRYMKSLHITIQLQNSKEAGKIYVPLLNIEYADVTPEEFSKSEISLEYSVNYFMDMSRSIEDIKISIGVLSAIAVLWSAIQAWSWNRRNGQLEIDLTTISNLLITACGNLADIFFVVCFCAALFWFVFFKKQKQVHVFLPDSSQEKLLRDLIISAFSLKMVAIIELIRRQATVDIFFIDWERPKLKNTIPAHQNIQNIQANPDKPEELGGSGEESVSIWRTYFVANEWYEIQTIRKVHMASQIIATIFFLEVFGFKFWGLHWPNDSLNPDSELLLHIPYSTSARFVVASIVFGLIGIVQWMFRIGFYDRYVENEIQDFVDLCTMSNISVFILAAKQHGYYIHGRSVHGFADTDMQTMIEQLHREEEDLCSRRGLLPQTDQQTFLISVPATFRLVYNQVLQPLYESTTATAIFAKNRNLVGKMTTSGTGATSKPSSNMLNPSIHAYHSMNRFLTAFLEHALSDMDYDITKKSVFEELLDMEFNEVGTDRAVFYTDNGHSFDSVLFYGNERILFLFNLFTFLFVDILSHSFVLAGVAVFISDLCVKAIRNLLGKRNLARKTLIDDRFLI